jgi:hypothetical protein
MKKEYIGTYRSSESFSKAKAPMTRAATKLPKLGPVAAQIVVAKKRKNVKRKTGRLPM